MTAPGGPETGVLAAVLAALRAVVDPVYDGDVPLDEHGRPLADRYAVLWSQTPERTAEDLAGRAADRHTRRWQVSSIGEDRRQVEWVAARCQAALLDQALVVDGWDVGTVEHTSSGPIRRDRDIPGAAVFYAADTYQTTVTPH